MRHLVVLTVSISLLFASVPAMADQAEDEAAIRKVVEELYAAMNKHDAKAYAALCDEDFETWEGDIKGRAAMEENMSGVFTIAKDIQFRLLDEIGIVFVTSDFAIYKHTDEITGDVDENGRPEPPYRRLSARVFAKKNGRWLLATQFYRPVEE